VSGFEIKNLIILSLFAGFILGITAMIPFFGVLSLFLLMLGVAPAVIMLLIMAGKFDLTTVKDSIIAGAITGFSANITFAAAFSVITVILYLITGYNANLFLRAMIMQSPLWLLAVCIMFVGVVTATTNAFTGFLTYYMINFMRDSYAKRHKNDSFTMYTNEKEI